MNDEISDKELGEVLRPALERIVRYDLWNEALGEGPGWDDTALEDQVIKAIKTTVENYITDFTVCMTEVPYGGW